MNFKNMGSDGRTASGSSALARQSSIYSLTFDEFQSTMGGIGKDFGSMNMDEFLKNIWTAEESQAMAAALAGSDATGSGAGAGLQRQGSLTLPRTLSQKTVDEVWRDLLKDGGTVAAAQGTAGPELQQQHRQPTLGEMTLEEFLVRAGVVREDMNMNNPAPRQMINSTMTTVNTGGVGNNTVFYGDVPSSNCATGIEISFPQMGRTNGGIVSHSISNSPGANLPITATGTRSYVAPLGNQQGMRGGGMVGMGDPGIGNGLMQGMVGLGMGGVTVAAAVGGSPANQISSDGLGKGNGDLSSVSPVPYSFGAGLRGRKCSAVEKVVERRQRRMIKNRESAARSRARKQAYTMELEAEVAKLKEQNQELQKKQAEILQMQKNQVMEMINQQHGPKRRCLRRTQTGPW
ncbi:hypothetical protein J5N97_009285 [Dioscorea zingiberensis]|uniref:BZIP domain-containing protein n=1 Tax=Dioscorea zingiberensis TaxID=325984 RepID=A0A9D5HLB8_9LILI|nr:hypothetical protein J5N97_009285 [Dioscorea zingiberensis]